MKDKLTAEEIAKKHYPDHDFEECQMNCMRCDNDDVCESRDLARKELTEDIKKLAESDLVSRKELLEWAEREKKHCTTSIKKSTFKSDLCVIGAVQAYKNIISHLTQPKEGEINNL